MPHTATCKTCRRAFDLNEIAFVDADYAPMVLSCQIEGRATRNRAMAYLREKHDSYEEGDIEDDAVFQYHRHAPTLSHMEPDEENHALTDVPKGFWSFDI